MTAKTSVNNRVLSVDLTTGETNDIVISRKERLHYLGGKGLAVKLLYDHIRPGIDPLSEDNILVFMTGPTAGTASPAGNRFAVVGKSPLTGIFGSSLAGGKFGRSLKQAGYDGALIRGAASSPVTLHIEDGVVSLRDAGRYWGMDTYEFQEERKADGDWVVIGPAGENRVRYAVIASDRRVAGRCGLGAVMGAKNLKGIAARGDRKFAPQDPTLFEKALKIARKKVHSHDNTGNRLRKLGTPQNVRVYGETAIMPVRNYSRVRFEDMESLTAEVIAKEHFTKNHGCPGCPIQCGRMGDFNGKNLVSPEYETIAMMGSNLMIGDITRIAEWNDALNRLGLDSISTGSTIGFAMELTERGLLDAGLSFGDARNIAPLLEDIAHRRGLGDELAEGVRRLSEKYGGSEFAIHVKGLELAAYDPRGCSGQGLGYATANSGATHLSGSTHAIEVESYLSPHGTRGKAHFVRFMQDVTDAVNSSIFCIQTEYPFLEENPAYKYTPMPVLSFIMRNFPAVAVATSDLSDYAGLMSGLLGERIGQKDFYRAGERTFTLDRFMNTREGIDRRHDTLPQRILSEARTPGEHPVELDEMLAQYYRLRGWDEDGRPTPGLLSRLDIEVREVSHDGR